MPDERLPMRKVREVVRLRHACGASARTIAQSVGVGRTTVAEYLRRSAEIDDAEPERQVFMPAGFNPADSTVADVPMNALHHESAPA